jgi:hypothetical protein
MSLKKPVKKNAELREEMLRWESTGAVALWWLGQSGFLIRSSAGTLLFDPYLSDTSRRSTPVPTSRTCA